MKRLLSILLTNVHKIGTGALDSSGLCALSRNLWIEGIIKESENNKIKKYLAQNAPKRDVRFDSNSHYWFEIGQVEPRREWLEKEILKQ